ncbi:MAG: (d)CMP kinase, partial [Candidatus Dormibacteria bacterium]
RALALAASRAGLRASDAPRLAELAGEVRIEVNTSSAPADGAWQARIDGVEVRDRLWDPELAAILAAVAREPGVRQRLLAPQRRPAEQGAVAVGRDTGTVVFPEAPCKVYLDAPSEVRIARRREELRRRGRDASEAVLRQDVLNRDLTDRTRPQAPLMMPPGALEVDTTGLRAEQVVGLVLDQCRRLGVLR